LGRTAPWFFQYTQKGKGRMNAEQLSLFTDDELPRLTDTDNEAQRNLYAKLIGEEFQEFMTAFIDNDDVEQLDACADMIWVIIGYALSRGWDIEGAWNEVTRSNFSKFDPETGLPIKNPETGKIMKPASFSEPELEQFTK
jgi:NTP pyrophosphatase (non-canonical NTP hydrolase)